MMKVQVLEKVLKIKMEEEFIEGIVEDILHVKEKYIFIARKGDNYNSLKDIDQAIKLGAIVLHEEKELELGYYVENLMDKIEELVALFYQNYVFNFKLIGVCGTNGKSSVVYNLYTMLNNDYHVMRIGTGMIETKNMKIMNHNTTPSVITLMNFCRIAEEEDVDIIVMEVSSQAIDENRIQFLKFDYVIYTNIERDHLDYHKTLIHYRYTKYKLVQYMKENGIIIANKDEFYFNELRELCKNPLISYGFECSHFQIEQMQLSMKESDFYINQYYFHTTLLGKINVYNISACIALMRFFKYSYKKIQDRISLLKSKEGRMEIIYKKHFTIMIDYAHSAKAFYEVANFLNHFSFHKKIVVVGCGGEREVNKREEIGYYASYYFDTCIFCEDNSRNEDIQNIFFDMSKKLKKDVLYIEERKEAIQHALNIVEKNDIILISGKGNEEYMIKGNEILDFNDKKIVKKLLE